jgi:DNA-binding transcriptional regulator YiaG
MGILIMLTKETLRKAIKQYRGSMNLSQKSFGKRFGRKGGAVSTWETGRCNPPVEVWVHILGYFNVKIE